jgi:hypothetical protein
MLQRLVEQQSALLHRFEQFGTALEALTLDLADVRDAMPDRAVRAKHTHDV